MLEDSRTPRGVVAADGSHVAMLLPPMPLPDEVGFWGRLSVLFWPERVARSCRRDTLERGHAAARKDSTRRRVELPRHHQKGSVLANATLVAHTPR